MKKEILINATSSEIRVGITEDRRLAELFLELPDRDRHVGSIYLGRVEKVIQGMNAAFVDIGLEQHAFLHFSDAGNAGEDFSDLLTDDDDDAVETDGDSSSSSKKSSRSSSSKGRSGRGKEGSKNGSSRKDSSKKSDKSDDSEPSESSDSTDKDEKKSSGKSSSRRSSKSSKSSRSNKRGSSKKSDDEKTSEIESSDSKGSDAKDEGSEKRDGNEKSNRRGSSRRSGRGRGRGDSKEKNESEAKKGEEKKEKSSPEEKESKDSNAGSEKKSSRDNSRRSGSRGSSKRRDGQTDGGEEKKKARDPEAQRSGDNRGNRNNRRDDDNRGNRIVPEVKSEKPEVDGNRVAPEGDGKEGNRNEGSGRSSRSRGRGRGRGGRNRGEGREGNTREEENRTDQDKGKQEDQKSGSSDEKNSKKSSSRRNNSRRRGPSKKGTSTTDGKADRESEKPVDSKKSSGKSSSSTSKKSSSKKSNSKKGSSKKEGSSSKGDPNSPAVMDAKLPTFQTRRHGEVTISLERGQEVLTQVTRESYASKGVKVSTKISLPGRFIVLMPLDPTIGISRKVLDVKERRRLRGIARKILPKGFGCIIRTVAQDKDTTMLEEELRMLLERWSGIEEKLKDAKPPKHLYTEVSVANSVMRDLFTEDVAKVTIDNKALHEEIHDYVTWAAPQLANKIEYYGGREPIFQKFGLEKDLDRMMATKVWLNNGGYIIIEQTEAMMVIDVNSGRYAKEKEQELNALRINLESAREIARQIRLRDIGGLLVVDFIDLYEEKNRKKVYDEIKKEMARDRAKSVVLPMTQFGIVQMTRQRVRQQLVQTMSEQCPTCNGKGIVPSKGTVLRGIERWLAAFRADTKEFRLTLNANPNLVEFLTEGDSMSRLTKLMLKYFVRVKVIPDESLMMDEFRFTSNRRGLDITDRYLEKS